MAILYYWDNSRHVTYKRETLKLAIGRMVQSVTVRSSLVSVQPVNKVKYWPKSSISATSLLNLRSCVVKHPTLSMGPHTGNWAQRNT